jgi:hypothetical protein
MHGVWDALTEPPAPCDREGAGHFAALYREHGVTGAHVIMLGPGNDDAAREALAAWPGAPWLWAGPWLGGRG